MFYLHLTSNILTCTCVAFNKNKHLEIEAAVDALTAGEKRLAYMQMQTGGKKGAIRVRYTKDDDGKVAKLKVTPDMKDDTPGKAPYSNWHGGNLETPLKLLTACTARREPLQRPLLVKTPCTN